MIVPPVGNLLLLLSATGLVLLLVVYLGFIVGSSDGFPVGVAVGGMKEGKVGRDVGRGCTSGRRRSYLIRTKQQHLPWKRKTSPRRYPCRLDQPPQHVSVHHFFASGLITATTPSDSALADSPDSVSTDETFKRTGACAFRPGLLLGTAVVLGRLSSSKK